MFLFKLPIILRRKQKSQSPLPVMNNWRSITLKQKDVCYVGQCWQRWVPACDSLSRRPLFTIASLISRALSSDCPLPAAIQSIHVPM